VIGDADLAASVQERLARCCVAVEEFAALRALDARIVDEATLYGGGLAHVLGWIAAGNREPRTVSETLNTPGTRPSSERFAVSWRRSPHRSHGACAPVP
jgi:hypothetical protein